MNENRKYKYYIYGYIMYLYNLLWLPKYDLFCGFFSHNSRDDKVGSGYLFKSPNWKQTLKLYVFISFSLYTASLHYWVFPK